MMQLFNEYIAKGKVKQALLVGQNLFNNNQNNIKVFESFFDYLLVLAEKSSLDKAKSLIQQAIGVLALFSENVDITERTVEYLVQKEEDLSCVTQKIIDREESARRERITEEVKYHNDALDILEQLLTKMTNCNNESDFNVLLNDLGRVDQSINRDRLSSTQENKYLMLTKKSSEVVSVKMASFEKKRNRDYNLKAIESYERIFNMFKNRKVVGDHKEVLKGLFVYDASRLYNETLVYYNHVYNYVLNKLSDEEKFTMTKYAIMCEKMR